MPDVSDERRALARRLRDLRCEYWPGRPLKQADLAQAIGVTAPAISSWESDHDPKLPTPSRLRSYAIFFATERSVAVRPYRLFDVEQLDAVERERRLRLLRELTDLRQRAVGGGRGIWYFPDGGPVTIVCSSLPRKMTDQMPYTDPADPDYIRLYTFADIDSLVELYGHVRANNPRSVVRYTSDEVLHEEQYRSHLAILGGVDWNPTTRYILDQTGIPVRQLPREKPADRGGFKAGGQVFQPVVRRTATEELLIEDVCHIVRVINPYDDRRTVTVCNGSYGRGTLAAVLAFTDERTKDENDNYLAARFPDRRTFSIVARVRMVGGRTARPLTLSDPDTVLHAWP